MKDFAASTLKQLELLVQQIAQAAERKEAQLQSMHEAELTKLLGFSGRSRRASNALWAWPTVATAK